MFIVFDLDGTLADGSHREHLILTPGRKQWDRYFDRCDMDAPIWPIVKTLQALHASRRHHIEIWSGRDNSVNWKTRQWLNLHGILRCVKEVKLKPAGLKIEDHTLKEQWLFEYMTMYDKVPDLVFEDRARVVGMWRSHGVKCCQVAKGDF